MRFLRLISSVPFSYKKHSDHSSFLVIHKVGNVDNFVLSKYADKYDREINNFNYLSKHYE